MLKLWHHQGGNVAILFGIAMVPLLALGGAATDMARTAKIRNDLQAAADTAAIAAARVLQTGRLGEDYDMDALRAEAARKAEDVFWAAAELRDGAVPRLQIDASRDTVAITTAFDVPTAFLKLVGIDALRAGARTEVSIPNPILLEVAMVLDYSGSMRENDKYARMTEAAQSFIRRVEAEGAPGSKIGIVPFSEYVLADIPPSYVRAAEGGSGGGRAASDRAGVESRSGTCVLNRGYPHSATDVPPSGLAASQWSEGDRGKCSQYHSKNLKLRDLTDEFDALVQALGQMEPLGLTNISLAAEMGWHVLSPERPFDTARDYSDDEIEKVLILLTDGMQTVDAEGPDGEVSREAADEVTAEICASAKGLGIRIFSIAYDVSDEHVRDLLQGCASNADAYFDARDVSDISGVFEQIFSQIIESVWVSR